MGADVVQIEEANGALMASEVRKSHVLREVLYQFPNQFYKSLLSKSRNFLLTT